jgi:hypothetical protein
VLVLVDQVEDFARWTTPAYKLRRDMPRLAALGASDALTAGHATFVLTMHPAASRVLCWYWKTDELGRIASDPNEQNVVRIGAMSPERFLQMVASYLSAARLEHLDGSLSPFTSDGLCYIHTLGAGRPGQCLRQLHSLVELALDEGIALIDRPAVERLLAPSIDRARRDH